MRCLPDLRREVPHRYRVAFERHRSSGSGSLEAHSPLTALSGGRAFERLVTTVAALDAANPPLDATVLWVALHGYASLASGVPAFPWPDRQDMLTTLMNRAVPGTQL
ncbi:WHG domain-containing protein [Nocardia sp. NBC_01377]|uniref:TetR-like C-terminal domain-containing protein n=1 Tax=Nocardia sp. NBC_01377 TaxID=2903595 RepID=UPI0032445A83